MTENRMEDRRTVLKHLGVGGMALSAMVGGASATAKPNRIGTLSIDNVEIGWVDLAGNWESAGGSIDSDDSFDVRVDISGLRGDSYFVSMAVPGGPNGELARPNINHDSNLSAEGSYSYTHGGGVWDAFLPDDPFGSWPEGTWRIYVSVFENDGSRNAHGVGTSGDIEID